MAELKFMTNRSLQGGKFAQETTVIKRNEKLELALFAAPHLPKKKSRRQTAEDVEAAFVDPASLIAENSREISSEVSNI